MPTNPPSSATGPPALLAAALAADAARPLLTYYGDATGERIELSVATYANWVAKTANLLRDELGAAPGDVVALDLPLHWQSVVWLGACWAGGHVAAPGAAAEDAEVVVDAASDSAARPESGPAARVSLGLGPMGLPVAGRAAPPGVLDYDREVQGHGDRFDGPPPDPDARALRVHDRTWTGRELAGETYAAAGRWGLAAGDRILVTSPPVALPEALACLLVPLAAGATSVLCRDLDPARVGDRVAAERVVASLGALPRSPAGLRSVT